MTSSVLILHLNSSFYIDDIATIELYHAMNSKVKDIRKELDNFNYN